MTAKMTRSVLLLLLLGALLGCTLLGLPRPSPEAQDGINAGVHAVDAFLPGWARDVLEMLIAAGMGYTGHYVKSRKVQLKAEASAHA